MNCQICNAQTHILYHQKQNINYNCCPLCEFISKEESAILSKEEELQIYNIHNNSIDDPRYVDFFYKFLNHALFPFIKKAVIPVKGFDFGSGPSPVLAQILERYHGYEMDIYDLFYSPQEVYDGKKYDFITSTEVVEHIKNPLPTFQLLKDLLEEDGVLAVMTMFHKNNEERFKNWHYIRDETHISFYTPKTMSYIADILGLQVIYSDNQRYTTFTKK